MSVQTKSNSIRRATGTNGQFLFVYGTLMRGQRLHRYLKSKGSVEYVGPGKIRAELYRPHGRRYPGAVRTRADRYVHGELYMLRNPSQTLKAIDKLEGLEDGLFIRQTVDVWRGSQKISAWTYLYNRSLANAEHISSGNFLKRSVRTTS